MAEEFWSPVFENMTPDGIYAFRKAVPYKGDQEDILIKEVYKVTEANGFVWICYKANTILPDTTIDALGRNGFSYFGNLNISTYDENNMFVARLCKVYIKQVKVIPLSD